MTYLADACPCCGARDLDSRTALMAPFIADYVLHRQPEVGALCQCRTCGLAFFAARYTDAEIARLYDDYRGERYLAIRHRFEPWYTRKFNDDIGGDAGMAPRQQVYRDTIAAHVDTASIGTVLDYAGDRGQMMQGGPGREHFVYEISGVRPDDGVVGISDPDALKGRVFDLVLACGVVEHFSGPLEQLRQVAEHVKPGGWLYVEVPDERFRLDAIPRGRWYERYLRFLAHTGLLLLAVDFWSTAWRVKFRLIPPLGFAKQHEHLNYFDQRSLSRLADGAGLSVVDCSLAPGAVVALCRRPPEPSSTPAA
jgi:SAM-dependent methyltransferase